MTRLLTIGFEGTPSATEANPTFEGGHAIGAGAAVTKETTVKRSGGASRKYDSGASNATVYTNIRFPGALDRGIYARGYFRVPALPGSNSYIMRLATGTNFCLVRLTTAGKIVLTDSGGTQIGSDSAETVVVDTWHRLELFGRSGTGTVDDVELRLNGTTVASATDQAYNEASIVTLEIGWMAAPGASKLIYWDDIAVNDEQGATQNSWPGAGSVVYLDPTADSARTVWTAGAGATTSLFAAVDNDPMAGVATGSATDTSQIKNTNTADTTGNYDATMETYSAAGLTAADTVTLVQSIVTHGRVTATVTGALYITTNPDQGSEESATWGGGTDIGTYATNWFTKWGTALIAPSVTVGTAPVLRVGRRQANTGLAHLCGMRIAVEYVPGTGQVLLPDADITTTGWTTTPLWSKLNDSSDATVVTATAA